MQRELLYRSQARILPSLWRSLQLKGMTPIMFDAFSLLLILRIIGPFQLYVDAQTLIQFRLWAIERRYL
jgi:hypothetical protein